jgi:uncharacterized membrane protein
MHSHGLKTFDEQQPTNLVSRPVTRALTVVVLLFLVATGVGLWVLRPTGDGRPDTQQFAAPGVTFPEGRIVGLTTRPCAQLPDGNQPGGLSGSDLPPSSSLSGKSAPPCGVAEVVITSGEDEGQRQKIDVPPYVASAPVGSGVILLKTPPLEGAPASYSIYDLQRGRPLVVLTVVFFLAVLLVARGRGVRALVGLGFAALVVGGYLLPSLLEGNGPAWVGLTASAAIMLVVLYLAHGLSARTTTALLGTFFGLALTAAIGAVSVSAVRLSGLSSDENAALQSVATEIDLGSLLTCGVILAGMGVLNDVTITQSSAVWELRAAAPEMSRGNLYATAMRIGRDHIGSTIYTIVFAYAGAALPVLLLIELYSQPLTQTLTNQDIAEELVRTMSSAIGLVLAVPVTTGLAVLAATSAGTTPRPGGRRRSA